MYVQIVSSDTKDSDPSVLLCSENEKYLFNVGEGNQRLCTEHKLRVSRVNNIILTNISNNSVGGLPGLILTISDTGKQSVRVYGPIGLKKFIEATSSFLNRPEFKIYQKECLSTEKAFDDGQIQIHAFPVQQPRNTAEIEDRPEKRARVESVSGEPAVVCYLCHTPEVLGKFNAERAKELGIPPGPIYGKLKSGESVTLEDGRVIHSEEVVPPPSPPMVAGIVCCPTAKLIDAVTSHAEWEPFYADRPKGHKSPGEAAATLPEPKKEKEKQKKKKKKCGKEASLTPVLKCLVHVTPLTLAEGATYRAWMKRFGPTVTHILAGAKGPHKDNHMAEEEIGVGPSVPQYTPFHGSHLQTSKMHMLFPEVFPLLYSEEEEALYGKYDEWLKRGQKDDDLKVVYAEPKLRYTLLPSKYTGVDRNEVLGPISKEKVEEKKTRLLERGLTANMLDKAGFLHRLEQIVKSSDEHPCEEEDRVCLELKHFFQLLGPSASEEYAGKNREKVKGLIDQVKKAGLSSCRDLVGALVNGNEAAKEIIVKALHTTPEADMDTAEEEKRNQEIEGKAAGVGSPRPWSKFFLRPQSLQAAHDHIKQMENHLFEIHSLNEMTGIGSKGNANDHIGNEAKATMGKHIELLRDPKVANNELVFLGTGAAIPSKYRNVTGIYLHLIQSDGNGGGMLLDCGEGTVGNLYRLYGSEEGQRRLKSLKAVWISHKHADHHLGLIRVLTERAQMGGLKKLLVICPPPVQTWLTDYSQVDLCIAGTYEIVCCAALDPQTEDLSATSCNNYLQQHLGLKNLQNVRVNHCGWAYGVVIESEAGWKLVYSGDCRPSQQLMELGRNCSILIHEATFEESKLEEAIEKKHSTINEAVDVANKMGAFRLFLTHFSQRYPKFPVLPEEDSSKICIAFDFMRVAFSDILWMPAMLAVLQEVYPPVESDEVEENQEEDTI